MNDRRFYHAVVATLTVAMFILAVGFANIGIASASETEHSAIEAVQQTWFDSRSAGDTEAEAQALVDLALLEVASNPECQNYAGLLLVIDLLYVESQGRDSPYLTAVVLELIDKTEQVGYTCLLSL